MNIINKTKHPINVYRDGVLVTSYYSESPSAECREETRVIGEANGIPLAITNYGEVTGLPEQSEGILYLVSTMIRNALPNRTDLATPGGLVRNEIGAVIGCEYFIINGSA